ncbi:MAG: GNAT family N-acetyltransferase, partial [Defluviitaleaceae bacterium]|nr:GNAT family N-acetyltransferase [Defluviitaleaceae bacterium]
MEIKNLDEIHKETVINYVLAKWGDPIITRGNTINISNLHGFIALSDDKLAGAILYDIKENDFEIVVLYSITESIGVGTNLINAVLSMAKSKNCNRVWLITMNDNTHAIRFYQKRGFDLKAVHINA